MFDDLYLPLMHANRQQDKNLDLYLHVVIDNFEAHQFTNDAILEMCDNLGLKRETKYLVKKSLDIFVLKFNTINAKEISFAAVNFLIMAVKFNQDPIFYQKLTIKWVLENFQFESTPYQYQDFVIFQLQIFSLPEFSLNFTTPYDYLGLFKSTFLIDDKMMKMINNVLDFSFTIPELIFCSAEDLFFGCLLMVYEGKSMQKQWMLKQTNSREKVETVSGVINDYYQREVELAMTDQAQL